MSHPRGAVPFEVDGKAYSLRYTALGIASISSELGDRAPGLFRDMIGGESDPFAAIRATLTFFKYGLRHQIKDISDEQAGDLIDALTIPVAAGLIGRAWMAAQGVTLPKPDGEIDARPPMPVVTTAAAPTGLNS